MPQREPLPYKHFYIWAESEQRGFRSYVARQDGGAIRTDTGEMTPGPIPSADVFDTQEEALDHAREMADIIQQ